MGDTMFFKGTKIQNPRKSRKNIYLCSLKNTLDMITQDQLKDLCKRIDALRRYL
jgi:hypothetical protein